MRFLSKKKSWQEKNKMAGDDDDFMQSRLSDILSGVFLLVLAMYGAYITQATGCQMQQ